MFELLDNRARVNSTEQVTDGYLSSQLLFEHTDNNFDTLLFECVTPIHLSASERRMQKAGQANNLIVKPERSPSVFTHEQFCIVWDTLQNEQKDNSKIHRTYWLGEAWQGREISSKLVTEQLVRGFAERIKRFRDNVPMNKLLPFSPKLYASNPTVYEVGKGYQEWYLDNKRHAKYDLDLAQAFIAGSKIKPISDYAFGVKTDVITQEEIDLIFQELKKNPEPRLEIRPTAYKREENTIETLAKGIQELVNIQKNTEKEKK